jgi:hypothetical protein
MLRSNVLDNPRTVRNISNTDTDYHPDPEIIALFVYAFVCIAVDRVAKCNKFECDPSSPSKQEDTGTDNSCRPRCC